MGLVNEIPVISNNSNMNIVISNPVQAYSHIDKSLSSIDKGRQIGSKAFQKGGIFGGESPNSMSRVLPIHERRLNELSQHG